MHHHRKTIPLETEFPSSTTVKLVIILKSDLIRGRTFELFDRAVLCTIKQKTKKKKKKNQLLLVNLTGNGTENIIASSDRHVVPFHSWTALTFDPWNSRIFLVLFIEF